jgi:PLP dependent protein
MTQSTRFMSIEESLKDIESRIAAAAQRSGRSSDQVRLVAVTKTVPAERVLEAICAGVTNIGENRIQEAEGKLNQLEKSGEMMRHVKRHLIGHLQSNKARRAVELFDFIHSVDSLKLAERLDIVAAELGKRPVVFAQVDLGKEATKTGVDEADLPALAAFLASSPNLDFRGLMTIPPFFSNPDEVRPYFSRLRDLLVDLNAHKISAQTLTELSMGMSHDFEVAIEEGATVVRIGTSIFGARPGR